MLTHLRGLGGQSGSRTKENEGLSVSNAHEIRYGLEHRVSDPLRE
jgi:hypothetical protein